MRTDTSIPPFQYRVDEMAAAERADGWMSACEEAGRFLAPNQQMIAALAAVLRSLKAPEVLEVCAGRGELAEALNGSGLSIHATDVDPPVGSGVLRMSVPEALDHFRPTVVLGSFVPMDSGVDEAVMAFPSVSRYVVLGARIGGHFGSTALWRNTEWVAEPLDRVTRWMLTRHDVWIGSPQQPVLQHGEAWLFSRKGTTQPT